MRKSRKVTAIVLVVCLLLSTFATAAFAAGADLLVEDATPPSTGTHPAYGPYATLSAGTYLVSFTGSSMSGYYDVVANGSSTVIVPETSVPHGSQFAFCFYIGQTYSGVEIRLRGSGTVSNRRVEKLSTTVLENAVPPATATHPAYGPYLTLEPGAYLATFTGSNMSGSYDITANNGALAIIAATPLPNSNQFTVFFSVTQTCSRMEARIIGSGTVTNRRIEKVSSTIIENGVPNSNAGTPAFGPYAALAKGLYLITFVGSGMSGNVSVGTNSGASFLPATTVSNASYFSVICNIPYNCTNIEAWLSGSGTVSTRMIQKINADWLSFDKQGGVGGADNVYSYAGGWNSDAGCCYGAPSIGIPARTGYVFGGYWSAVNGGGIRLINDDGTFAQTSISARTVGYAKWIPITYYLDYNAGTGSGDAVTQNALFDASFNIYANPGYSKTGYTFNGWYCSNGASYAANQSVANLSSTNGARFSMTAQWQANTYTVKYQAGVDGVTPVTQKHTYDEGSFALLPENTFSRAGYTFAGWKSSLDGNVYLAGTSVQNLTSTNGAEVTYTAQWLAIPYTITFQNYDSVILQSGSYTYGDTPVYDADANGIPQKSADAQYTYTWNGGWSPEISPVTGEAVYTAVFESILNNYTVKFIDGDGNTIQESAWGYGSTPAYDADANGVPSKTGNAQFSYTWNGSWDSEIVTVTGDAEYTALFDESINSYTVKFINWDGTVLQSSSLEYGDTPVYDATLNGTPEKAYDDEYHYVFNGTWDNEIVSVTGEAVYTAEFDAVAHTFENYVYNNDRTCDIDGTHTGECVCGKTHTELDPDYPSFGGVHLFENYVYNNDATCLENGTETAYCERCLIESDTREAVGTALGHEFLDSAYVSQGDATCLEDGHETATCSRCDVTDTRIDVDSALGHDFIEYTDNDNETCTVNATETAHCTRCDAVDTREIPDSALGHDYVQAVIEPGCATRGLTKHICSRCSDMYCDSYVDALGHEYGEWHVVKVPTCTVDGKMEAECARCGDVINKKVAASHTPSGRDPSICLVCGEKIVATPSEPGTGGGTGEAGRLYCCESHNYPNTFWGRILAFICRVKQLFLGVSSIGVK